MNTLNQNLVYSGHENLVVMTYALKYNAFLNQLVRNNARESDVILDFGAGLGAIANTTRQWSDRLSCVEPDDHQLQLLIQQGFDARRTMDDFSDESLDFIYSFNVLEHIEDDLDTLKMLNRKLNADGRVLIYVPALQFLYSQMDARVGHIRRYSLNQLIHKLDQSGFDINSSYYVDSLGVLATLVYKIIGNKQGYISVSALKFYDKWLFPLSRLLDVLFSRWFGKNLLVIATKRAHA